MDLITRFKRGIVAVAVVALLVGIVPAVATAAVAARSDSHQVESKRESRGTWTPVNYINTFLLKARYDFLKGPRRNSDGTFNTAIEIPAGTNAKWETSSTATHFMYWEFKSGKPRVISYLPYVGNYGSLVNSKADDGDPLDVLVLAPAVDRGTILKVRIVGVLKVSEPDSEAPGGKVMDDKLIAVTAGTPLAGAASLADLDAGFPGITDIVKTWFLNYKGVGAMNFEGWGEAAEANALANSVAPF